MNKEMTITNDQQKSTAGWTPFHNKKVKGWPVQTILRGQTVMKNDELIAPVGEPVKFKETL